MIGKVMYFINKQSCHKQFINAFFGPEMSKYRQSWPIQGNINQGKTLQYTDFWIENLKWVRHILNCCSGMLQKVFRKPMS